MGAFPDHLLQYDEMTQRYFRLVSAWKATDRLRSRRVGSSVDRNPLIREGFLVIFIYPSQ